jgi:mannose-1-phosphate guanylyltransferase
MITHAYAVIMAGGAGTRFWPASRLNRPKQLLALVGEQCLLRNAVERISPSVVDAKNVLIVTGPHLEEPTRDAVGDLGVQLVIEPMPRNTAPCIALAAARISAENPQGVMAVLPADHHIDDAETFRRVFRTATEVASTGRIVTLGITPDRPETGYGYIRRGDPVQDNVFAVAEFVEKPDLATAQTYLQDEHYSWNSGMFFMRVDVLLEAVDQHMPGLSKGIRNYQNALGTDDEQAALRTAFEEAEAISIDYGVMENESHNITVIPVECGWSDVGSWRTLCDFKGDDPNFVRGSATVVDTSGSVIISMGPHISVIGMKDVAVVSTDDAVLVVPLERSQEVGPMVKALREGDLSSLT